MRLRPGVWTNATAIGLTGVGTILAAGGGETGLRLVGGLGCLIGVLLLLWGLTINGHHWRHWRPRLQLLSSLRGQLYIGQILAFDTELVSKHTLSISIRVYNGTLRCWRLVDVQGKIGLGYTLNGTGVPEVPLSSPTLATAPADIKPGTDSNIDFVQHLIPQEVTDYQQWVSNGADIVLSFTDLTINVEPNRFGKPRRLLLWDGITLRDGRFLGRIMRVTAHATSRARASLT